MPVLGCPPSPAADVVGWISSRVSEARRGRSGASLAFRVFAVLHVGGEKEVGLSSARVELGYPEGEMAREALKLLSLWGLSL